MNWISLWKPSKISCKQKPITLQFSYFQILVQNDFFPFLSSISIHVVSGNFGQLSLSLLCFSITLYQFHFFYANQKCQPIRQSSLLQPHHGTPQLFFLAFCFNTLIGWKPSLLWVSTSFRLSAFWRSKCHTCLDFFKMFLWWVGHNFTYQFTHV